MVFDSDDRKMESYRRCVPVYAMVKRQRIGDGWFKMESNQLVPGDIVKISANHYAPADIRVIEVSDDATADTRTLFPDGETICLSEKPSHDEYLDSTCMIFAGSHIRTGTVQGIVCRVGKETVIANMIKKNIWPPTEAILSV